MRIYKDALLKHHFWILLSFFRPPLERRRGSDHTTPQRRRQCQGCLHPPDASSPREVRVPKDDSFTHPWVAYGKT